MPDTAAMEISFNKVGVLGAGTMGAGIAGICAAAGFEVVLYNVAPDQLKKALSSIRKDFKQGVDKESVFADDAETVLDRITTTTTLEDCAECGLIIEAIVERLDIKRELLSQLDAVCSPPAILATNTRSLSVTAIAAGTRFPERVCGTHFLNPPQQTELVEIVRAQQTAPDTIKAACAFAEKIGKRTVCVKDSPGFIVTRLQRAFFSEALRCLGEDIADFKTIDEIFREGAGFRMGPFENMDLIGIDTDYAAARALWEAAFHKTRFQPHLIQKKMVEAGRLGRKTGEGFYEYGDESAG